METSRSECINMSSNGIVLSAIRRIKLRMEGVSRTIRKVLPCHRIDRDLGCIQPSFSYYLPQVIAGVATRWFESN